MSFLPLYHGESSVLEDSVVLYARKLLSFQKKKLPHVAWCMAQNKSKFRIQRFAYFSCLHKVKRCLCRALYFTSHNLSPVSESSR